MCLFFSFMILIDLGDVTGISSVSGFVNPAFDSFEFTTFKV
jgi:hypothetical protein